MSAEPGFDPELAHKQFSVGCFNAAWDLIDRGERTAADELEMLQRAMASLWQWTQRPDCTARHLSIGYWQVSRVLSLIGEGALARRYGEACLEASRAEEPFFLGYAYESCARAAIILQEAEAARHLLDKARECLPLIEEAGSRDQLALDLQSLAESPLLKQVTNTESVCG